MNNVTRAHGSVLLKHGVRGGNECLVCGCDSVGSKVSYYLPAKKSASVGKGTYLARESEVMNQFLLTTPLLVREWLAVLQFMGPRRTGVSLGRLSLSCKKKCAVAPMRGRYQRPSKPSETP
jgi:hypothetical protein